MQSIVSFIKLTVFIISCLIIIPIQAVWAFTFQKPPLFFSLLKYHEKLTCAIFGIKVNIEGTPITDRQVIFVGNHLSYIDIVAILSFLHATFIAKADVRGWPIFGLLAKLNQTVFIGRNRNAAPKAIADIKNAIDKKRSLIIFPEGTSTQGTEVLPFKSSLFDLFLKSELKENTIIQPFTISIIEANKDHVTTKQELDLYAWYGDMTLLPHLWALGKSKGAKISVHFHPPRYAKDYDDRKIFARDCHSDVAKALKAP